MKHLLLAIAFLLIIFSPVYSQEGWRQLTTYSRDEQQIATASWDGTAKIWDAETGQELDSARMR